MILRGPPPPSASTPPSPRSCDNCYARVQNEHWKWVDGWGPDGERRRTSPSNWHKLRKWNREAKESGIRRKVFSNSLSDFFDNKADRTWRREAWHYIEQSPNLDFLILTKRPQNIAKMLPDPETGVKPWGDGWPNVWIGTTCENQEEADRRIPYLIRVPAAVHFLSCEPLLGELDLEYPDGLFPNGPPMCCSGFECGCMGRPVEPPIIWYLKWIIAGGESGPHRRRVDLAHMRSLRDQCAAAGVAFFGKQDDKIHSLPADLMVRQFPEPRQPPEPRP